MGKCLKPGWKKISCKYHTRFAALRNLRATKGSKKKWDEKTIIYKIIFVLFKLRGKILKVFANRRDRQCSLMQRIKRTNALLFWVQKRSSLNKYCSGESYSIVNTFPVTSPKETAIWWQSSPNRKKNLLFVEVLFAEVSFM